MNAHSMNNAAALEGNRAEETGAGSISSRPVPVSFHMPVPPSVNSAYKNTKRGRAKTKAYQDWLLTAYQMIRLQDPAAIFGECAIVIGFERDNLLSDVDNRVKLALDAIVSARVIEDDRHVTALAAAWLPKNNGLAHVQIHPIQAGQSFDLQFHASSDAATGAWIIPAASQAGEDHGDQAI